MPVSLKIAVLSTLQSSAFPSHDSTHLLRCGVLPCRLTYCAYGLVGAMFVTSITVRLHKHDTVMESELVQAYFMGQQYRRALMLLRSTELMDEDAQARFLAARCLAEVHDWEECLSVLGDGGFAQGSDPANGIQSALGQQVVNTLSAGACSTPLHCIPHP